MLNLGFYLIETNLPLLPSPTSEIYIPNALFSAMSSEEQDK